MMGLFFGLHLGTTRLVVSTPDWILETGVWNDAGVWDDTETWDDGE